VFGDAAERDGFNVPIATVQVSFSNDVLQVDWRVNTPFGSRAKKSNRKRQFQFCATRALP
jgi:hypothetical protein